MIEDYTNQTITIEHILSSNSYGEKTYSAPVTIAARLQYEQALDNPDVTNAVMYVAPGLGISIEDRVTILGRKFFVHKIKDEINFEGQIEFQKIGIQNSLAKRGA